MILKFLLRGIKLKIIVAINEDYVIGRVGLDTMPWRCPEDLQHFKDTTTGHIVIMGRKTFQGLHKPLGAERLTLVLSRNGLILINAPHPHWRQCMSIFEIAWTIRKIKFWNWLHNTTPPSEDGIVYVAGGREVYETFLPYVDEMLVSKIPNTGISKTEEGLIKFPRYKREDWDVHTTQFHTFKLIQFIKKTKEHNGRKRTENPA